MKLNKKAFGLSAGIIWGLGIFVLTNFLILRGSEGLTISKLGTVYFGYSFTFLGSLIGLLWGFLDGFVIGWLFALVHNIFIKN